MFDGLEISQFTYFQQAGGVELSPVSAELTYGLERIAMALQRVDSVFDLEWARRREVPATCGCARRSSSPSTSSTGRGAAAGLEFGAFHRDLFDEYYAIGRGAARSRA